MTDRDALTIELGGRVYAWLWAEQRLGTRFVLRGGQTFADELRAVGCLS